MVPVYNEIENLTSMHRSLRYAMQSFGRPYEILFVDDGSTMGAGKHYGVSLPRIRVCAWCCSGAITGRRPRCRPASTTRVGPPS